MKSKTMNPLLSVVAFFALMLVAQVSLAQTSSQKANAPNSAGSVSTPSTAKPEAGTVPIATKAIATPVNNAATPTAVPTTGLNGDQLKALNAKPVVTADWSKPEINQADMQSWITSYSQWMADNNGVAQRLMTETERNNMNDLPGLYKILHRQAILDSKRANESKTTSK